MKPHTLSHSTLAFTLVELLTVMVIFGILAALLLPVLSRSQLRAKRIVCENNLEQIGLAFHAFSNDHAGKFPMAVSTNENGSLEYVQSGFGAGLVFYTAYRHFQALSGELVVPRVLVCPADMQRAAASNFPALQNDNVSYYVGVDATFDKPASILAGDRNLATNAPAQPTILQFGFTGNLRWTWELHQYQGNVLFADGHVEELNNSTLPSIANNLPAPENLFLPSVAPVHASGGTAGYGSASPSDSAANQTTPPPAASPAANAPVPSPINSSADEQFYRTSTIPVESQPPAAVAATPSAPVELDSGAIPSSGNADSAMSPFNQHLTRFLQHLIEWGYLLLWLLLLLYLIYKLRQRARRKEAHSF